MKKGICLTAIYPQAMNRQELLTELFWKIKKEGIYQCAEFYFEGNAEAEKRIRKVLKETGLSAVYLAGFPLKRDHISVCDENEERRREAVKLCLEYYEHAKRIGAEKMLILSGPRWKCDNRKKLISQARRSFSELSEISAGQKTEITLEFFPSSSEPFLAIGDIEMVKEIYQGFENKIGITFDTSHVAQMKEDVLDSFRMLKPWIHHLHLANSMSADPNHELYGDRHPLFALENGDFSVEEVRSIYLRMKEEKLLQDVSVCSMEVISRGREDWYYEEIKKEANYIWNEMNGGNIG